MGESVIPSDWEGQYCCYSVMWPNSPQWLAVLRGVLVSASRGRYWAEATGNIIAAQEVIKATFDHNLANEECIVSCNDSSLSEIAEALRMLANAQCCGESVMGGRGSGGATGTMPDLSPIVQGDPLTDEPPEGFESWEEFLNDKCGTAHNILDQFENSLEAIVILNFGTMGLDAMGFALTIAITSTVPPATIVAIAAFLVLAYGQMIITTLLSLVAENKGDLVCELYNGDSAESSLALFHTALGTLVDSVVSDVIENAACKQVARYFINNMVVNRLYEKDLTRVYATQDCSDCDPDQCLQCIDRIGGGDTGIVSQYDVGIDWNEVSSESFSGYYVLGYKVNTGLAKVEWRNISGNTEGTYAYVVSREAYGDELITTSFATFQAFCETFVGDASDGFSRHWMLESVTPFTVEIKTTVG